jgi:hypothetical protein
VGSRFFSRIIQSIYFRNYYVILCSFFSCIKYYPILFFISTKYDNPEKKYIYIYFFSLIAQRCLGIGSTLSREGLTKTSLQPVPVLFRLTGYFLDRRSRITDNCNIRFYKKGPDQKGQFPFTFKKKVKSNESS